ncbi:hypothetical protein ACLOJK_030410 [Asimina triloba]
MLGNLKKLCCERRDIGMGLLLSHDLARSITRICHPPQRRLADDQSPSPLIRAECNAPLPILHTLSGDECPLHRIKATICTPPHRSSIIVVVIPGSTSCHPRRGYDLHPVPTDAAFDAALISTSSSFPPSSEK